MRLLFGWLGDRWGHKRNLVISALSMALAAAFALNSSAVAGLIPAFICLACAISSDMVSHFQHRAGIRRSRLTNRPISA